jgi:FkbM family methyltransferase
MAGINKVLAQLMSPNRYEQKFRSELIGSVQKGDVVWDVGANVGFYTTIFSELVGEKGLVFAFEPSIANLKELKKNTGSSSNSQIVSLALADRNGTVSFYQGEDDLGATSRVLDEKDPLQRDSGSVETRTGDSCIELGLVRQPNVVKIDVEGFELDVLNGMKGCIASPELRVLLIEVHFGLLAKRGRTNAPKEIEQLIRGAGFSCHWSDASHIVAKRP